MTLTLWIKQVCEASLEDILPATKYWSITEISLISKSKRDLVRLLCLNTVKRVYMLQVNVFKGSPDIFPLKKKKKVKK